ncbi:olfactory receptor 5AR1-like [Pelobates fuscus]|uniref:olfactory receptor 5AR1-like n=1 Tax=Pelobates fuscus TaxID=191477 RepID=UPI002FE48436
MGNITEVTVFLLTPLSDNPQIRYVLFVVFLLIYMITLIINSLIILLFIIDAQLRTPMFFFLGNLAFLDMSLSSVTAPRMLSDFITTNNLISFPACMMQIFFLTYFASIELFLLGVMSYDRFSAICHPLHYVQMMSWNVCFLLSSMVWGLGFLYSLVHTLCSLRLAFCSSNIIHNFFCDLPHLFQISCTNTFINMVITLTLGGSVGLVAFLMTFIPYTRIFSTIIRIQTKDGKLKAFSTCTSHLTVVFIFYASLIFIYFVPNTHSLLTLYNIVSIMYAVINPLLNPLIYSVRNKELKAALERTMQHLFVTMYPVNFDLTH